MALDARITDVVKYTGGCTLVLEARDPSAGPAGQPRMEILNPTVTPLVGDTIWGGSEFAFIVSGDVEYPYKREGYTKLIQNWGATDKAKQEPLLYESFPHPPLITPNPRRG